MCCNLNEMYVAAAKNRHFAKQGRASANVYAEKVKEHFFKDAELSREYHQDLLDGKWNHMMSQVRIGYSSWDQPRANIMPAVSYVQVDSMPRLGYVLEPGFGSFDPLNQQDYYVEIYNRGGGVLAYELDSEEDWIQLSQTRGSTPYDDQIFVSVNWEMVPDGVDQGTLKLRAEGQEHQIGLKLDLELPEASGFLEKDGVVSIEAVHFTRKVETDSIRWTRVPNLGRTHSSMITEPVNVGRQTLHKDGPRLEYDFTVFKAGQMEVECYLSPTQNLWKTEGLTFAVSIDDGEPQVINLNQGEIKPDWAYATWWMKSVGDHIKIKSSIHEIERPGKHTLKIWAMDPAIVFQKFVIDAGGKLDSYLGPPESQFVE
jgi:hypothetical protein